MKKKLILLLNLFAIVAFAQTNESQIEELLLAAENSDQIHSLNQSQRIESALHFYQSENKSGKMSDEDYKEIYTVLNKEQQKIKQSTLAKRVSYTAKNNQQQKPTTKAERQEKSKERFVAMLTKQLKDGVITQEEYDRRIERMEKKLAKRAAFNNEESMKHNKRKAIWEQRKLKKKN